MHRLCVLIIAVALAASAIGPPAGAAADAGPGLRALEVDSLDGVTGFFNLGQGAVRIV